MPIYLLLAMNPTLTDIEKIHQTMAKFFWGNIRHWAAWNTLCFPTDEGGLGLKFIVDVNRSMMAKLWWKLRTDIGTLWASYMGNK